MLGRRHDEASSSSIGLVIAAVTFASAFMVAQLMVAQPGGVDPKGSQLDAAGNNAMDLMIRDSGRTINGGDWAHDPDTMLRFGMAKQNLPNFLDYPKIKALRNGTMTALANDAPDYPEVKTALDLDSDFHLRSYPVLPSLEDPRWTKDTSGRLAYFGHYAHAAAPAAITASATNSGGVLNISVTIKNDGASHAIYVAVFSLGNQSTGSKLVTEERHTRLLAPGETQTVWTRVHALPSWADGTDAVHVQVVDSYGGIAVDSGGNRIGSMWLPTAMPVGSGSYNLLVGAANVYYVSGDTVTFIADHYGGDGGHVSGNPEGRFVLLGPNGNEWTNHSVSLPKQKNQVYSYACSNCTSVGNYTAILWNKDVTRKHVDQVHVAATTMFKEKRTLHPIAQKEIAVLESLVGNFNETRYDELSAPNGDVFGDDSNGPSEMVPLLERYTTIVIGSDVKQTALNSAHTKYGIAAWVQAGGNLIVLGTYNQESRWIEPVYHAAQTTANGGISAPDPTHPVLTVPNRLQYDKYLDRARAWSIEIDAPFTHILARAGSSTMTREDTLAVSHPGAYNDGTVVLTSYMPGALTSPQDDLEARKLLHNLLSQSHSMLFLDYGPPIPDGVPVGSAQRLVAVPHPNVPGAIVEVRLIMYVWGPN